MEFDTFAIPVKVLEDIKTLETRRYVVTELVNAKETRCELREANAIISEQKDYIAKLEKQTDDLQKALDAIHQNKCKVKKTKPVRNKSRKLQRLEIIVRENNDMPYGFPATVGVKCYTKGKPYGLYSGFGKPELTVAEVVETANLLIEDILGRWQDGRL